VIVAEPITVDERPWVPVVQQPSCRDVGKRCLEMKYRGPECQVGTCAVQTKFTNRSAEAYIAVLDALPLLDSPRYFPRAGLTFCNIFVWDATLLLGCEIPHWVTKIGTKADAGEGREQTANDMAEWLSNYGQIYGWGPCGPATAQLMASRGNPAVAVWRNPGGTGHIAMVRPGELHPEKGPCIAQAGKQNFRHGHVLDGFGHRNVEYFVHLPAAERKP
jgi:hypothetical protein